MKQTDLTRREFLKFSAAGVCGLCLAGCGMKTSSPPKEYWEANKDKLMDDFDSVMNPARRFISETFSPEETNVVIQETQEKI